MFWGETQDITRKRDLAVEQGGRGLSEGEAAIAFIQVMEIVEMISP